MAFSKKSAPANTGNRPANTAFKQQTLKAWRPILTPRLVILLFASVGILFVPIGLLIIVASNGVVEVTSSDYAESCCIDNCDSTIPWARVDANPCTVSITVEETMEPPVYVYYKLTNYYQNHRRYVRSRDDQQLKGEDIETEDLLKTCEYHYQTDLGEAINPCGLVAWSVFNDSFTMSTAAGDSIAVNETGIAWPSDLEHKFKNAANGTTGSNFPQFAQWRSYACAQLPTQEKVDLCESMAMPEAGWCFPGSGYCAEDEHFVVWMRAAGLPNFRKLYGIIHTTLVPGTYNVRVSNGVLESGSYVNKNTNAAQTFLYPVASFGGTKAVVLSTTSWMGGKNYFLGYAYIIVGVICVVLALAFCVKYNMSPRDLGDASYITWQKDSSAAM